MRIFFVLLVLFGSIINVINAQHRDISEANSIASNFYNSKKLGKRFTPNKNKVVRSTDIIASNLSDAFYVFSNEQNRSFVIVSAYEQMDSVLAYSENTPFDYANLSPEAKAWIHGYVEEAKQYEGLKQFQIIGTAKKNSTMSSLDIAPLILSQWDQDSPFNSNCPKIDGKNALTGCVSTAMSQVMNYYKYPNKGNGSINYTSESEKIPVSFDFESNPFDWSNMLNSYNGVFTQAQSNAVSMLMAATGASVQMDYNISSSGAYFHNERMSLINYFGYDNDMIIVDKDKINANNWNKLILHELSAGRPVLYSGDTFGNDKEGHAFILDGYKADGNEKPFFHVNWGWGGYGDGYFKMTELKEYNKNNQMILYAQPENDEYDYDCFIQSSTIICSPLSINTEKTQNISITLSSVENPSLRNFSGQLCFYLENSNGQRILIHSAHKSFLSGCTYNVSEVVTIPSSLELGKYNLRVFAQIDGGTKECEVFMGNEPELTISNEVFDFYPDVQITEMSLNSSATYDRNVNIVVSKIMNYSETPFQGKISLAVTDILGNIISVFGNANSINSLSHFSYLIYNQYLTGIIPDDLIDGHYYLCAVAQQEGYTNWTKIKGYELSGGYIISQGADMYIDMWIKNGKIQYDCLASTDMASYNYFLSGASGSLTFVNGSASQSFYIENTGDTPIRLISCIMKKPGTYETITKITNKAILGELPAHSKKTLKYSTGQTSIYGSYSFPVYEWHYIYNGYEFIYCTDTNDPAYVNYFQPVLKLGLSENATTLSVGDNYQLVVDVYPSVATNKIINWRSNDIRVATVDQTGNITAVGAGTACIIATTTDGSNLTKECIITVSSDIKETIFEFADGMEYTATEATTVDKFIYKRSFNSTNWQAFYLPVSVPINTLTEQGLKVAYINNFNQYDTDGDNVPDQLKMEIFYVENGLLYPNYPYMVKAITTGEKEIVVENARIEPADINSIDMCSITYDYEVKGNYQKMNASTLINNGYYIVSGGSLKQLSPSSTANLGAERWYLIITPRNSPFVSLPKEIKIQVIEEDNTDNICSLNFDSDDHSYSLMGQKINSNNKKGIMIRNGKKLILR